MSTRSALLRDRETTVCRQCHNTPKLAAGRTRHSAAEDCSGCHFPHGGGEAAYLRFSAEDLCAACHKTLRDGAPHTPAENDWGANLLTPQL
jgi:predicted CXXCH cytochrome family protein